MNFQGKIFFTQNWCNITLIEEKFWSDDCRSRKDKRVCSICVSIISLFETWLSKVHIYFYVSKGTTVFQMNFQGKIFFTQNWCNITLIYHRSFDRVVAIYYSNLYIKRLNNIEIDNKKKRYF
jgi:hypothetical protein